MEACLLLHDSVSKQNPPRLALNAIVCTYVKTQHLADACSSLATARGSARRALLDFAVLG